MGAVQRDVFNKLWDKVDADRNGVLSEDELRAASHFLESKNLPMSNIITNIFKYADMNKDRQVSRSEWEKFVQHQDYPQYVLEMIEQTVDKMALSDVQNVVQKMQSNIPVGWQKNSGTQGAVSFQSPQLGLSAPAAGKTWDEHVIKNPPQGFQSVRPTTFPSIAPPGFQRVPSRTRPGQFSYYCKKAGIMVENVEQAWSLKMQLDEQTMAASAPQNSNANLSTVSSNATLPQIGAPVQKRPAPTDSTMTQKVDGIRSDDGLFRDSEFPPDMTSIGKVQEEDPQSRLRITKKQKESIRWIRLPELIRLTYPTLEPCLFDDCIEPNDLTQGAVGDCWLLASMAGLAEFPEAVKSLFLNGYNEEGKYNINLYDMSVDKWTCVTIDDSVPCLYEEDWSNCPSHVNENGQLVYDVPDANYKPPMRYNPLFARLHSAEMWTMLLEKAVAKFCGGCYSNIAGGHEPYAYIMFTGYPIVYVWQRPRDGEAAASAEEGVWERGQSQYDPRVGRKKPTCGFKKLPDYPTRDNDELFEKLASYDMRNYLMGASITAFEAPKSILGYFRPDGIVLGHAYSLITASYVKEELPDGTTKTWRMILLRNPHGKGSQTTPTEWNGRWSDKSELWKQHPQVAEGVDFKDEDDGLFWMQFCDFCSIFDRIHILAKSMKQPRAQEALLRRQNVDNFGISLDGMDTSRLVADFRRMTIQIDPFQNAPPWVSKKGVDGLMQWYAEKGTLESFVGMNPWMKERAEKAGLI